MNTDASMDLPAEVSLERMMRSLQALALPAAAHEALFPDFVCRPDELALDFDDARRLILANPECHLNDAQRHSLELIDGKLAAMSRNGPEFTEELWSEEALHTDPQWDLLRTLANTALRVFGWPDESPPVDPRARGVGYVRGGETPR